MDIIVIVGLILGVLAIVVGCIWTEEEVVRE
jgi:flagellar motor component MotA